MSYRLEWQESAEINLQRIWLYWQQEGAAPSSAISDRLRSQELRAIQESADKIETLLQHKPMMKGRSFRGDETIRVFEWGPLSVGFQVLNQSRIVRILAISYNHRRN